MGWVPVLGAGSVQGKPNRFDDIYISCEPIFPSFFFTILSLHSKKKKRLSSLSCFFFLLRLENGWWREVPARWLADRCGGATTPDLKGPPFFDFFQFPNPFTLFYLFLPSKLSQSKSSTLDLN